MSNGNSEQLFDNPDVATNLVSALYSTMNERVSNTSTMCEYSDLASVRHWHPCLLEKKSIQTSLSSPEGAEYGLGSVSRFPVVIFSFFVQVIT